MIILQTVVQITYVNKITC